MAEQLIDPNSGIGGTTDSGRLNLRELTRGSRVSLRHLLFAAFIAISIVPVGILALWTERSAYEKELAEVSERHLLIARNLSHALTRYSQDVVAVFGKASVDMQAGNADFSIAGLLHAMGFDHACLIDRNNQIFVAIDAGNGSAGPGLPQFDELWATAMNNAGKPAFTGVMATPIGEPRIFVVQLLEDGNMAVGSLKTDYLVKLQKAVAFGEKGHSAIVDAAGRVLAHPRDTWQREMKDISAVSAVRRMMAGETGVATFYSPALEADMIAGFTTVPVTGWGIMVPQPIAELEAHASSVQRIAIFIGLVGMTIAVILAWILSRYLARPIERIAGVARSVRAGDPSARVGRFPGLAPMEIDALASSINQMLGELARSGERLRDKADEAETANRAKSRFLANMSHEFRTPLNAIIGYSEIMRDGLNGPLGGDGVYKDYADNVHDAGNHILGMVNEILLLTRAEAGHLTLHNGQVSIQDCIRFALSMIDRTARENDLHLSTTISTSLPVLWTDDGKLRQVLLNLVSNAAKFTDKGGKVTFSAEPDPVWAAVIRVTDTGVGIRSEDLAKVMQPFGQVQDTFNRNHGGTGLGLPLTQELVSLMGGEFELKSQPGVGTEAIVRLPLRSPDPDPMSEDATTHEETMPAQ
jgi:signal transduction histidine kinase